MTMASTAPARVGLLLINLGSPDQPTAAAVRRYLAQFLSDRRVVELPALLWQPILRGIILTTRPPKTARTYAAIWDREHADSPLRVFTAAQARGLAESFGADVSVDYAMRYGNPSIGDALDRLAARGCDRILLAPLYPQYCAATTASALDAAFAHWQKRRVVPAVRTLPPYFAHPAHIDALARSVRRAIAGLDWAPDAVLLSFHGMPAATRAKGDPYYDQCHETARRLRTALGLDAETMPIAFQSRFGRARWLEPYAVPTLEALARAGRRKVAVLMPGFAADCIETLEEIAIGARDAFLAAGGAQFAALPCLNASADGLAMLRRIVGEQLAGWVEGR
jgi:ferrochelatase